MFGEKLSRRKVNLTLRCDNMSVTSALKKGRAKDVDLAIIVRLIVKAMIKAGTILKFWRTESKSRARVEWISSKDNRLADALSRDDLTDFRSVTNKIPNFKQVWYKLTSNTRKSTATGVKNWCNFCREFGQDTYVKFGTSRQDREQMTARIADWLQWNTERKVIRGANAGKLAMTSADSFNAYLAALIRATKEAREEWNPTIALEEMMQRIKKQFGSGKKRKLPIFMTMVDEMERSRAIEVRDRDGLQTATILMFTIFGLLRISEVMNLEWRDIKPEVIRTPGSRSAEPGTSQIITLTLRKTKTSRFNEGLPEYVVLCQRKLNRNSGAGSWDPIELATAWDRVKECEGARCANQKMFDLTRDEYAKRLKRALEKIGIESNDAEIMEFGRWKSDSWKVYCRQVKSKCLAISRLLGESQLRAGSLVGNKIDAAIEMT